jgi:hypothetical protein
MPNDENFHFETDAVMEELKGTEYLRDKVEHHLHYMTTGERWSLYRAIVTLADKQRGTLPISSE